MLINNLNINPSSSSIGNKQNESSVIDTEDNVDLTYINLSIHDIYEKVLNLEKEANIVNQTINNKNLEDI